jgi:type II secretory ATPase GspE/PulE/Tfp pilus assembly ATPase PilB-like protein
MSDEMLARFRQLIANPEGMVLVTGPTGSGKTTTLYAALHQLRDARRKIVSAEDPIEYLVDKINQRQISAQMSMSQLLRALLRQDPDVMLFGEVRDLDSAQTAVRAAATGHLVLGTLHTRDAIGAVVRLRGIGLRDDQIGDALLAVVAQRLVRRVCTSCARPAPPTPAQERLFGSLLEGVSQLRGAGCSRCEGTGYKGRTGIFELLVVDEALQDRLSEGTRAPLLREHVREGGFTTLVEDGLAKVHGGGTTLEELVRCIPYRQIEAAVRSAGSESG